MSQPAPYHSYTFRDYLDLEAAANVKHEFFNGELHERTERGFRTEVITGEQCVLLPSIGAELSLAAVYSDAGL